MTTSEHFLQHMLNDQGKSEVYSACRGKDPVAELIKLHYKFGEKNPEDILKGGIVERDTEVTDQIKDMLVTGLNAFVGGDTKKLATMLSDEGYRVASNSLLYLQNGSKYLVDALDSPLEARRTANRLQKNQTPSTMQGQLDDICLSPAEQKAKPASPDGGTEEAKGEHASGLQQRRNAEKKFGSGFKPGFLG